MKNFLAPRLLAAVLLLTCASFAACSKGTETGDTNVERASNKDFGQSDIIETDDNAASTRAQPDTANMRTGKEVYKAAGNATDRNQDGLAD